MSRFRLTLVAALILSGAALFQGNQVLTRRQMQSEALQRHLEHIEKEIAVQHREFDVTAKDLSQAERQLSELAQSAQTPNGIRHAHDVEISAWLARAKRLKQLFEERSDQKIPELRLLSDADWLRASKGIDLDSDEGIREALASTRTSAKRKFIGFLASTMLSFTKANNGAEPTTIAALVSHLQNPADFDVLDRYEITPFTGPSRNGVKGWAVQEKAAADADYDTRLTIEGNAAGITTIGLGPSPQAWIPDYAARSQRAYRDYAAANQGATPASLESAIPYFNPPLDTKTVDKLLRKERSSKP